MKDSMTKARYDYDACGIVDTIGMTLIHRVVLLFRRGRVHEQPSAKLLVYAFSIHHLWFLHSGGSLSRRIKGYLVRIFA